MVLVLLALARPQFGERPTRLGQSGRDLLIVLDLSRSMNAVDGSRSRLTVAKQLVGDVLTAAPGHRVGLVVFGVEPPDHALGVLQDMHWAIGAIGYFSTYALGNVVSGQLWEQANAAIPDLGQPVPVPPVVIQARAIG